MVPTPPRSVLLDLLLLLAGYNSLDDFSRALDEPPAPRIFVENLATTAATSVHAYIQQPSFFVHPTIRGSRQKPIRRQMVGTKHALSGTLRQRRRGSGGESAPVHPSIKQALQYNPTQQHRSTRHPRAFFWPARQGSSISSGAGDFVRDCGGTGGGERSVSQTSEQLRATTWPQHTPLPTAHHLRAGPVPTESDGAPNASPPGSYFVARRTPLAAWAPSTWPSPPWRPDQRPHHRYRHRYRSPPQVRAK